MTEPYYADEWVTLYHGDWRELIDPDLTADLIVTDPPYGETSLEWDRWPDGWSNLAADRFTRVHDHALHWYRGPWGDLHHETPVTLDAVARRVHRRARPAQWIGASGPSLHESEDGGPRLMRSVIYGRSMHGRALNETEKPAPIVEHLISYGCPRGGVVLDVFAGSCSTLAAARATERRAIGFELRESQCEKAALRLSQGVLV